MFKQILASILGAVILTVSPVLAANRGFSSEHQSYHSEGGYHSISTYHQSENNIHRTIIRSAPHNNGQIYHNFNSNTGWHRSWTRWNNHFGFWFPYNGINVFVIPIDNDYTQCNYWDGNEWVGILDEYGNPYCPD